MRLWHISDYPDLGGLGGLVAPGRWHSQGNHIVYLAESSALAMLEVLVNLEVTAVPASFQLIEVEAPDDLAVLRWPEADDALDERATREWGNAFLRAAQAPLARVPSAVAPDGWNYLLNPRHSAALRMRVVRAARWPWDARLFGREQGR